MKIDEEKKKECSFSCLQRAPLWMFAIALRVIAFEFCHEFLSKRAELVVPHNSFRRLADGVHMRLCGLEPYEGDMLHSQPILLDLFAAVIDHRRILLLLFTICDLIIGELLRFSASVYLEESLKSDQKKRKAVADLVLQCYLLNPVAVGACAVFSLSVLYNLFTALLIVAFVKGWLIACAVCYAILVHFTLYPAVFMCALLVRFPSNAQRFTLVSLSCLSLALLLCLNFLSNGNFSYLDSTYAFLMDVRDLSPNVGIFWYFFIEVFNHFRLFFIWVFQLNILIYLLPLALTLRSNSFLLLHQLLILVSVFSSYPSMAESVTYLSLVPVFVSLRKYIRWGLVIGCTLASCCVLAPIMWHMWIVTGSGNANFYFAVTLCYSVAQIFLMTDLLYAHLREKVFSLERATAENEVALFVLK